MLLVLAAVISACARTPPEQALREALAGLFLAVEARDAGVLRGFLAEDFIGPDGLDRDGARRMAAVHLMRHDGVGVTAGPLDVALQGDHARVRFSVVLTGRAGVNLLPDNARAWQVDTGWRLVDGEWRMTSAAWAPVAG
ncbi:MULTISPECIES: nuclear transport factor 2 family protein [unclassified Luteimonas]|uniref:nuclear transport factor 2 family protein n=1 Tax=unclassified Luteimonas TaxID=2629088 RepID=UPI0016034A09|nr:MULTISPECIES: nuclear transport factor 2 family protein [unclassified Luteimonas]MBB1471954.1 nuclear transport factor 2 family protein [Luteimonas sp. MC1782]QOC87031.1 nuclear transport factor 2 family protein [Luteimonas sp. MC1825]